MVTARGGYDVMHVYTQGGYLGSAGAAGAGAGGAAGGILMTPSQYGMGPAGRLTRGRCR